MMLVVGYSQSDFAVDECCPFEALVEDNAEELHRLLKLDRVVIDLLDEICGDMFASREKDGDCLVGIRS